MQDQAFMITTDVNLFTFLFLLIIFLGFQMQITRLTKKIDRLLNRQK